MVVHTPLVPALWRERQANLYEASLVSGLQSKFQDNKDFTEKSCLEAIPPLPQKEKNKVAVVAFACSLAF